MKREDTKKRILEKALELFSERGYDAVSVGEVAAAVGIKAPSLYNHYESKRAIFDAILQDTAEQYKSYTNAIDVHVPDAEKDTDVFAGITEERLLYKVRQIFTYSLHNEAVSRLRRMLTIEQLRSPELAGLYSQRYVDRLIAYHSELFDSLIAGGVLENAEPDELALMYTAPIITLLGICDRQPERETECQKRLDAHVRLFFRTFNAGKGEKK